jgi:transcriptional regulator with GAF, ATPase, and Fis domain
VRELQNVVERAVILARGGVVPADAIAIPTATAVAPPEPQPPESPETLAAVESRAILAALEASNWRISGPLGAARRLGLKPTTLHARMKKQGIRRPGPTAGADK